MWTWVLSGNPNHLPTVEAARDSQTLPATD
jgi:hypothetical protein